MPSCRTRATFWTSKVLLSPQKYHVTTSKSQLQAQFSIYKFFKNFTCWCFRHLLNKASIYWNPLFFFQNLSNKVRVSTNVSHNNSYAIFSLNLLAEFHGFDIENRVERFIFLRNLAYATYNQHTVNKQTNRFSTNCSLSHCLTIKYWNWT